MGKGGLGLAFDIGHSSIGWAVLDLPEPAPAEPEILGCGSVIFPADDCLASQRRNFRRTRRHIRATRQRIARLKRLLLHLDVLDAEQLDARGHSAPWKLAAVALTTSEPLSWENLWHVLRWYAHNRGYDGNRRWSKGVEEDAEDTEKEANARVLMTEHGTETMAETVCATLGIDPLGKRSSTHALAYKTLNAAFPREVVVAEVRQLLELHRGKLPGVDKAFIDSLVAPEGKGEKRAWATIEIPGLHLPRRYLGGLLFGQLIPRFDNRIIAHCPFTGDKVPNKACIEFLRYRWAMLLANIRADGLPLSAEHRQAVHAEMEKEGKLDSRALQKLVRDLTGCEDTNIAASFEIHPDSKDALVLDPARAYGHSARDLKPIWRELPAKLRRRAEGRWKKGRPVTLQWFRDQLDGDGADPTQVDAVFDKLWSADQRKKRPAYLTPAHLWRRRFGPKALSGRAPYSQAKMRETFDFVLATDRHPSEVDGPLHRSEEILAAERGKKIDELTNNHLVRHRLKILRRLTDDIIAYYADGDPARIRMIVVEVARDLQEFSGMSAKEMAAELNGRLRQFKAAVDHLEKNAPNLKITGGLIRKCRLALDLNWRCPFTGETYDAQDLPGMDREHIVPYADRPTNALHALVLTFPEVNKMKGRRTARAFIAEQEGQAVPSRPNLSLSTLNQYDAFVAKLDTRGHADDQKRKRARKALLRLDHYEPKQHGFTDGALTQTSHLNRLAQRQLEAGFVDPETGKPSVTAHALPGQVTAEVRKAWDVTGCLVPACPEAEGKKKGELREITHLHHALDAAVAGLATHYLPRHGGIWETLVRRHKSDEDIRKLQALGIFKANQDGRADLQDLPREVKQQLTIRLAEGRVVQHVPADQSGARAELNPWRIVKVEGDPADPSTTVQLRQVESKIVGGKRVRSKKKRKEKAGKLLGLCPDGGNGKLAKNRSVLILSDNYGIALDPTPTAIPFHKVPVQLAKLREENGGKAVRVLRNGMLIEVPKGRYQGTWRVRSCKASATGVMLRLTYPHYIPPAKSGVPWAKDNVSLKTLLENEMAVLETSYIGTLKKPNM